MNEFEVWREVTTLNNQRKIDRAFLYNLASEPARAVFVQRQIFEMVAELNSAERLPGWQQFAHARQGIE